jgi:RNA polymerase sigma-70 factor (ECF subfamily)
MSSDAAAYFPDTLASAPEVRESDHQLPGIQIGFPDGVQPGNEPVERRLHFVEEVPESSDETLLKQVREGAKEALAVLFRRHARAVRNIAHRILRNESEADDLVQEVFLHIFRKAALFDAARGNARSWIFNVAYHRAFDRRDYLNSRHFYSCQDLEDAAHRLADPREEAAFHEQSIEGILGKPLTEKFNALLSPEQRETIQLFFFEGYALKEIAQRTGQTLVNVRNHYYRGLERMRKYVFPEKLRSK